VSSGYLCRCGYDADDLADLARHITSWERWEEEATGQVTLAHFED
jgi:hypothetical protein